MKPDPAQLPCPPGALVHHIVNRTPAVGERANFEWLHYCARHEGIEDILNDQLGLPMFISQAMVADETRSRAIGSRPSTWCNFGGGPGSSSGGLCGDV